MGQTIVPGFAEWERDERTYLERLDVERAQLAINSALTPSAPRRAKALPLFDQQQPTLL